MADQKLELNVRVDTKLLNTVIDEAKRKLYDELELCDGCQRKIDKILTKSSQKESVKCTTCGKRDAVTACSFGRCEGPLCGHPACNKGGYCANCSDFGRE